MANTDKAIYNAYMKKYMLDRYHVKRTAALEKLGGKCVYCGTDEQLEFDHIDPESKTDTIGKLWSYSKDKLEAELNLCQLLCRSCHSNKSILDAGKQSAQHGTLSIKNCKCEPCRLAKNKYMREWKKRNKPS